MLESAHAPATPVPSYLCHNSGGRKRAFSYVYEDGRRRRVYLGAWGSPDSKRRYHELISGALAPTAAATHATPTATSIEDLVGRCLFWAQSHYVKHGRPTGEWNNLKEAAAPVLELFRDEPAAGFGPKKLRMVRDHLLQTGRFARRTINAQIQRVRRIFRWGVAEELVPAQVWESLRSLLPLQRGRTSARETAPVNPVPLALLKKTLPQLTPTLRAMAALQLLTGMRPNEVVQMRAADIEMTGPQGCWVFLPRTHKTEHRGKSRRVVLAKRAQLILKPFLSPDPEALLFTPARSEEERRQLRRRARKSKVPPSQHERDLRHQASPRRQLRPAWTSASYLRAVYYACDAAGAERWSPGRLRHNFEDAAEQACGLEAASKALGHSHLGTTEHYRNRVDLEHATRAVKAVARTLRFTAN